MIPRTHQSYIRRKGRVYTVAPFAEESSGIVVDCLILRFVCFLVFGVICGGMPLIGLF
jgi:hypothetical protein